MIKRQAETFLPTKWGDFRMIAYSEKETYRPHLAMVGSNFDPSKPVIVRIHSECITGDLFGSKRCDCGEQLEAALRKCATDGGVIVYMRQEGRGIGIINKMRAYNLQDKGLNTLEANLHLGFDGDLRSYEEAIEILKDLGIKQIQLVTNNPDKILAFDNSGIEVVKRVPIQIPPSEENIDYLITKEKEMGHLLNLDKSKDLKD
ncbi:MAG: GTP cyclohydrolase II [Bacteroidota bacterium]